MLLQVIKWKVGTCWSTVNPSDVAGCLYYYANFDDALAHARENYTAPVRIVVYIDNHPSSRVDYLGNTFEVYKK